MSVLLAIFIVAKKDIMYLFILILFHYGGKNE